MIRLKTINVDGNKIERTFESIAEILKNWWDEDGTDLPGGDDEVIELAVDGKSIRSLKYFAELIHELEILFWRGVSEIKKTEEPCNDNIQRNQNSLEETSGMVTEYCPHCNDEIMVEWDVKEKGYQIFCPGCGRKLMLCSECLYEEELCDWSEEKGFCYRQVEKLWKEFGQVPFAEDEACGLVLEEEYRLTLMLDSEGDERIKDKTMNQYPAGTNREEIWEWYDENHPKGIGYLLYGEDKEKKPSYNEQKEIALRNILQAHGVTMEDELDRDEEFYLGTNQFFRYYKSVLSYFGSNTKELFEMGQIIKTEDGYVAVDIA